MPYVATRYRKHLLVELENLSNRLHQLESDELVGVLNYVITTLILKTLPQNPRYADYNAAIGMLECCKLEFSRKMLYPYEDGKCQQAGEVFPVQRRFREEEV